MATRHCFPASVGEAIEPRTLLAFDHARDRHAKESDKPDTAASGALAADEREPARRRGSRSRSGRCRGFHHHQCRRGHRRLRRVTLPVTTSKAANRTPRLPGRSSRRSSTTRVPARRTHRSSHSSPCGSPPASTTASAVLAANPSATIAGSIAAIRVGDCAAEQSIGYRPSHAKDSLMDVFGAVMAHSGSRGGGCRSRRGLGDPARAPRAT